MVLSKSAKRVFEEISADRYLTKSEIAERIGCCQATVKRAVQELRDAKLVDFVGTSKDGHWQIAA